MMTTLLLLMMVMMVMMMLMMMVMMKMMTIMVVMKKMMLIKPTTLITLSFAVSLYNMTPTHRMVSYRKHVKQLVGLVDHSGHWITIPLPPF